MKTKNDESLECAYCDNKYKFVSERRRHELSHFNLNECKECNKKFNFLSALRRHERQHKRTEKVFCNKCGRSFCDDNLLKRHMNYAHKGKFECDVCNSIFTSDLALKAHSNTHIPEGKRRFCCSHKGCGKSFNFQHHLKCHEFIHSDVKQYNCDICGRGFAQLHNYKSHVKIHNPDDWFYCSVPHCKKRYRSEYARKKHLATHNNLAIVEVQRRKTRSASKESKKQKFDTDGDMKQEVLLSNNSELNAPEIEHKETDYFDETNNIFDNSSISDCKNALGQCIVSDHSENCLCAQMPNSDSDNDIKYATKIQIDLKNENVIPDFNNPVDIQSVNKCEPCDSTKQMWSKVKINDIRSCCMTNNISTVPEIEYKNDGTIQIKELFDDDFEDKILVKDKMNDNKPYNRCKDILGNCIAGEDGDKCLCAKMTLDEQVNEQEIDEITPMHY